MGTCQGYSCFRPPCSDYVYDIRVIMHSCSSFNVTDKQYLKCQIPFMHFFADGNLFVEFLHITNSIALNTCPQVFWRTHACTSIGYTTASGIVETQNMYMLTVSRYYQIVSQSGCTKLHIHQLYVFTKVIISHSVQSF